MKEDSEFSPFYHKQFSPASRHAPSTMIYMIKEGEGGEAGEYVQKICSSYSANVKKLPWVLTIGRPNASSRLGFLAPCACWHSETQRSGWAHVRGKQAHNESGTRLVTPERPVQGDGLRLLGHSMTARTPQSLIREQRAALGDGKTRGVPLS